jgi:hypothetical protein
MIQLRTSVLLGWLRKGSSKAVVVAILPSKPNDWGLTAGVGTGEKKISI